ncbi:ATP-dependent zinc metalloprotease FtsH [Thiohalorhabdus methylotrophus]|uniref:ATP-dependent zinc metalloprotease FtsH n=1 Tax=Thiohalorhabdus methylotrophus TaxID=3242694 RepID=A0ABV4TVB0_9GAMM
MAQSNQEGGTPEDGTRGPFPPREQWRYWIWFLVLGLLFGYFLWMGGQGGNQVELSYTQFKQEVRAGTVAEVTVRGQRIDGRFKSEASPVTDPAKQAPNQPTRFTTAKPPFDDPNLMDVLEQNGVKVTAVPQGDSLLGPLLIGLLPLLLIIGLIWFASRRMQSQLGGMGQQISGFTKSQAKRYEKTASSVTFEDVAGSDNAKRDLQELVDYLKEPEQFRRLGAEIPHGVLLMGPPGTGKTLMAKAVAGEAGVPFYSISGSQFVEMFVGVGASRVRDMFNDAKKEAPAIIFIDEIDAVGRQRGAGLGGGHDEREQTLNQILAEMDGFESDESVVVMAATNRPDVLDSALLRPGRFDRKVTLERPPKPAREAILRVHTRDVPLGADVDLGTIAARTVGFSGADLENLVNEAALFAARARKDQVDSEDFDKARDKILFGSEREDLLQEDEKRRIAYHESGHTLVARLLRETDPLKKVTIIPRGQALGATEQVPEEDRYNYTVGYLRARLAVMLGGRVAEKVRFNDFSTGAHDDLKQTTRLARQMVTQWGMSDKVGPVAFREGEEHVFLGREMGQAKDYSEYTARIIDQEVHDLIAAQEKRAEELLAGNRDRLDALAEALLERETLDAAEIDELLGMAPDSRGEEEAIPESEARSPSRSSAYSWREDGDGS